ncbi:MAG TPA: DUF1329 domain-containing protein [Candidatus Binataceae bacterium]|nr:DUF1329 domain-containing protein [Candidatus Binataceae bacterium]
MLCLTAASAAITFAAGGSPSGNAASPAAAGSLAAAGTSGGESVLPATEADGAASATTIPPGTVITPQNWRRYDRFMPDGMIKLFEGVYPWKMPPDVEMDVGPTVIHPLPQGYLAASEKQGSQTKLVDLPGGGLTIVGYEGGIPFPVPSEPHQGWKILANFWYRYIPHIVVNTPDNLGFSCTLDSFSNISCVKGLWVYRQLSFNTDPGVPQTIPGGAGKFYTTWFMVEEPEQQKYSATLTIGYDDLTKPQDIYTFAPALRRAQRLSAAARCATSGLDTTPDDGRFGFDANIPEFDATLLGSRKILSQMDVGHGGANFPQDYAMPLGWSKPSWGKWELRDVDVLDVRKIPSQTAGYCYGKRIMYIDKQFYGALWLDLYDAKMQLWKIALLQPIVINVPGIGPQNSTGAQFSHYWDIQNQHATFSGPNDGHGYDVLINDDVPKSWDDLERYTTPGGLSEVMR